MLRWARVALAVVRRPSLWATALRQVRRLAAPGWWRRPPLLPLPSRGYRDMRAVTQYGEARPIPEPHDVVHYIMWCRQWEAGAR